MGPARLLLIPLMMPLIPLPAQAGPHKCVQPDGGILYQQGPCAPSDQGGELELNTRPPGGQGAASDGKDLSVQGQLKALESTRAKGRRDQAKDAKGTAEKVPASTYDRAKCAKNRAATARWQQEVRGTYRTREEKAHDRHMLEYHQALVERYCPPE